ncbi:hypothetical protein GCK72_018714 [Caenorhabditis remanei]|uniref:Decapping nuclease n=1 Tax=Caenorhabditis remanei TaxID=31234 RepID=A0A6A5GAX3_CAERE|nr:hypothetical protein GCK72_018714 [Caenorhabditis remanei]KAF1752160.1 hypothetical protein GCK72_018714 [Caenorhabditis remanei]
MHVTINIQKIGTYTKLPDRSTIPFGLPPLLNEDENLYGLLEDELDLTLGLDGYKDTGFNDKYHSFFDYMKRTYKKGSSLKEAIGADFVSNRRNLVSIAKSPYEVKRVEIQAIRKNGVIFLCDKKEDSEDYSLPYGHRFERYLTLDKYGNQHNKYETLTTDECSKCVLRTTLSSGKETIKLFYSAEIDAIDREGKFVELKTTSYGHMKWLERRSLDHYLQSFFANVPYIIYGQKAGYRSERVFRVNKKWTNSIPNSGVNWKKEVCFNQLFQVLQKIKSKLEYDEEALVLHITREGLFFEPECSNNCTFMEQSFLDHFE